VIPVTAPLSKIDLSEFEGASRAIRNVLVVDDSRAQRHLIATSIRGWGFNVLHAASGEEALALCQRLEIDLVLSDWMMPGMNGIDFCRALRRSHAERYIYFILLTAKSDKAAVTEGLEVGADDYLSKPVDAGELRARIKRRRAAAWPWSAELRANNRLLTRYAGPAAASLYDSLDRDLIEARNLQQSRCCANSRRQLRPAGWRITVAAAQWACRWRHGWLLSRSIRYLIGLYAFDVSGHGVASALMTARLAGLLSGASAEHNIAIEPGLDHPSGATRPTSPPR
jgi:phosphoserine phosphatase RsbU/P